MRTVYRDIATLIGAAHPDRGRARDWLVLRRGFELPPLMFTDDEAEAIAVGVRCSRAPAIQERLAQRSKLDPPAYDGTRTAAPAFQRTRKTAHHPNRRGIRRPSADAIGMRPTKANWVSNDSPLEGDGFYRSPPPGVSLVVARFTRKRPEEHRV